VKPKVLADFRVNSQGTPNALRSGMPLNPFPDPQTYKIIGAGMAVHSELGCGFLEKVYRLALPFEFGRFEVPFAPEKNLKSCYKGRTLAVDYFVDFICFGNIVVEVKAQAAIGGADEAQLLNYLKASGMRRGLILNFGATSFQHKRMVLG
jgi:GxxExxY protein